VKNGDADRKTRIADAAIEVLGRDGLRALTHRAVDARAGLPQGTCSYHHRTRRSLLAAVLHRIADLDRADMAAAGPGGSTAVDRVVAMLARWLGPGRVRTRARLVLMLDAEARRDLGAEAGRLAAEFVAGATATLGSAERARLMVALLDGLVADDLVRGGDAPPPPPVLKARVAAVYAILDLDPQGRVTES
jgi:DNA-binding transcriptional regulator YbjK